MIASQIALQQQRITIRSQVQMVNSEVMHLATSAGLDILNTISAKEFDAHTAGGLVTDPLSLTALPFTTGGTFESANDIDDYHGIQAYTYTTDLGNIDFDVDIIVRYVEDDDMTQTATTQTFAKEVVVTLQHDHLFSPIELSEVFTYP